MSVRDTDRGARNMTLRIAKMAPTRFTVGIHEDVPAYPDGTSVATVAGAHEYGQGNVPQRSWLRGWFDGYGRPQFGRDIRGVAAASLEGGASWEEGLAELGKGYVATIKDRIKDHIAPELARKTVERKVNTDAVHPEIPLIDTSHFFDSIAAKVTKK